LDWQPKHSIDTFPLAKTLLHYLPSYALDIINEQLRKTDDHRKTDADEYHDALHDSYLGLNLFKKLIERLMMLRRKYLILDYMFQNSDGVLADIIRRTPKPYKFEEKELFFPPLAIKQV